MTGFAHILGLSLALQAKFVYTVYDCGRKWVNVEERRTSGVLAL